MTTVKRPVRNSAFLDHSWRSVARQHQGKRPRAPDRPRSEELHPGQPIGDAGIDGCVVQERALLGFARRTHAALAIELTSGFSAERSSPMRLIWTHIGCPFADIAAATEAENEPEAAPDFSGTASELRFYFVAGAGFEPATSGRIQGSSERYRSLPGTSRFPLVYRDFWRIRRSRLYPMVTADDGSMWRVNGGRSRFTSAEQQL